MSQRYIGGLETLNPTPLNPALGNAANGIFSMSQYFSLKNQGLWPAIDPYFDYTTLLLHGNGTNGGQNNTFLDSSSNNFTITRNGNTTQGTFSPFSQTGWSNYFDGSGDYLTFPNSSAFAFGAGAFTIEFWIYGPSDNDKFILGGRSAIGTMHITTGGTGSTGSTLRYVGSSTISSGSTLIVDNQWHHCAIVRDGSSNVTLYVDGVSRGTGTDTTNYTTTSGTWVMGANDFNYPGNVGSNQLTGYISNFRIVKGTAVYTSAFTPPTAPLTAITNTSLLICQSNRFVDNSASPITLTPNGSLSVQAFSPFAPTAAYSASTVGGSGYFDGSGDYLTFSNSIWTALAGVNTTFTVEAWVYQTAVASQPSDICGTNVSGYTQAVTFKINTSGGLEFSDWGTGSSYTATVTANGSVPLNAWTHVAASKSGSTMRLFVNGVLLATNTIVNANISTLDGSPANIAGRPAGATMFIGYMSSLRIVPGTAVYTANFTPPTGPLTAISGTSLLLNFTNAAIIDNTAKNVLETVGNAQISTTQSKFGGASLAFDGAGDYLVTNCPSGLQALGTGNFTIEMWAYWNSLPGSNNMLIDYRPATTDGAYPCLYLNGTTLYYYVSSANQITATSAVATGAWYHVALCRASNNTKLFVNGTQVGSTYADTNNYLVGTGRPYIAINGYDTTGSMNGYIDDLRITKGIARYTANFTPQTSQWQDQ